MQAITSMFTGGGSGGGQGEAQDGGASLPKAENMSREEMVKSIESLQKAQKAQSTANDLKSKAMAMTDSKQREKIIREAFDKEMEAHGHSKAAQRLQSGPWQGLGIGGGMGAAAGLGTGAALGTVLGVVTAIPTTLLGAGIGTATGAIRGPWIKLGGKDQKFEDADPEQVVDAMEEEQKSNPQLIQKAADAAAQSPAPSQNGEKKKPKKLEVRSQANKKDSTPEPGVNAGMADESKPKRKPKKLEVRSKKEDGQSGAS